MSVNVEMIHHIQSQLGDASLVAATKYVGLEELEGLYENNVRIFGENKVQALVDKYEAFPHKDVTWHFIGTLQNNKVKYIIDKVALIHSVDHLSLVDEINKQAKKHELVMPVLLQVNISHEETKHGFDKDEVREVINYILEKAPNVEVHGLMTMAPNIDPAECEQYFKGMHDLLLELQNEYPQLPLKDLSMGMSNDYEYALKNGATYIRVGSKLFNK